MKVALDATPLVEPAGGIRRYTLELARALAEHFPQDEYLLVSDQSYQASDDARFRSIHATPAGLERRWWAVGLPRFLARERCDVFHGGDFAVPYWPVCPSVLTLHDCTPWRTGASARVRRRTPLLLRFGLPTMVITPSEAVRGEAIERFRLPPEEVVAVPLAASAHFRPVPVKGDGRPYFLFVGTNEPRKNVSLLVEAWEAIRRGLDVDLRLIGRGQPDGVAAEEDMPALYSGALALLLPSIYEGFGLPVVEAMQCGAPVIISRDPALREAAAEAALVVDERDPRAWAQAMRAVATNSELRAELRRRSLLRARTFSWARTAAETHQVYETAMRRFHG